MEKLSDKLEKFLFENHGNYKHVSKEEQEMLRNILEVLCDYEEKLITSADSESAEKREDVVPEPGIDAENMIKILQKAPFGSKRLLCRNEMGQLGVVKKVEMVLFSVQELVGIEYYLVDKVEQDDKKAYIGLLISS